MSSQSIYFLGVYIPCTFELKDTPTTVLGCSNPSCKFHGKRSEANFCWECGAPIVRMTFLTKLPNVDLGRIDEGMKGRLTLAGRLDGTDVWIPNLIDFPCGVKLDNCAGIAHHELTPEIIKRDLGQFWAIYKELFEILIRNYGQNNVQAKWGLVHMIR